MQLGGRFKRGVDVARFKADQLIRVNRVQTEIDRLRREIANQRQKLADLALELHKAGNLRQPELSDVCRAVDELGAQIATRDVQIANIKAETLDNMSIMPIEALSTGQLGQCPHCRSTLPSGAEFCGNCGKAVTRPAESSDTTSQEE